MKLLLCTQVVDKNDPVLGFFVRWIEEFKREGEGGVISLKTLGRGGRVMRAWHLLRRASAGQYDAVFVHMNPEDVAGARGGWELRRPKNTTW